MRRRSITFFGMCLSVALASCGGGSSASTDGGSSMSGCGATYAGCTAKKTVDDTAIGYFEIGIITSSSSPPQYSEPCVLIKAGQTLGIAAGAGDPLAASSCSPAGPLPTTPALGTMNYTFTTPGNYGYHSTTDGADDGSGMSGLIVVE